MSKLDDRLPAIESLRAQRNALGHEMYGLRTQIARTRNALRKQREAEGRLSGPEPEAVAAAREEIARLEAWLKERAAAERAAAGPIARRAEAGRRVDFLDRSLASLRARLESLERLLDNASGARPKDHTLIAELSASIAAVREQIADLERSLEAARGAEQSLAAEARVARETVQRIAAEAAEVRAAIDKRQTEIGALRDASRTGGEALEERLAALNETYTGTKRKWRESVATLHGAIKDLYVDPHPRATVAELADSTPFLLLPIRIETRFVATERAGEQPLRELWVRIYPDDIAVHTHEDELTDREVEAGEAYWRRIFTIEKDAQDDKEARKTDEWKTFAPLFGPSRSAWVARQTRPSNWAGLATLGAADELVFPVAGLVKTSAWSRAPRTHVMPDRFVVMLYSGETIVHEAVGEVVPDELMLGPEPLDLEADDDEPDVEGSFVTVDGQLTFGKAFDWTSNFARAVELGMGFRIPITAAEAEAGFDKILVLGVIASAPAQSAKQLVEELLGNHHHSPKGLTLLRQGTATNNTDDDGSGYSINDSIAVTQEVTGLDAPLFNEHSVTDGRLLADALGIRYETLQHVYNSDNSDHRDAVAMNCALYPATLGYYFDALLPVLAETDRDRLRDFFVERVTGRGPLPSIRIGDQPYGVLLTSDFASWQVPGRGPVRDGFQNVLLAVLRRFDGIWQSLLPELMYAGKTGVSSEEVLINVLGLQPSSVTFASRVGYSSEYLSNLAEFQVGGRSFDDVIATAFRELYVTGVLRGLGYETPPPGAGDTARLQLLRLIYRHYTTGLDAANVVDGVPLSETALVREHDPTTHKNYLNWLAEAASADALAAQDFGGAPAPTALLYLELRHALILQLHKAAVSWMRRFRVDASKTIAASTFHNVRPGGTVTRWEVLKAPVAAIDATHGDVAIPIADYLLSPSVDLDETQYLDRMRAALVTLSGLSTARLERCFVEHIDSCTYRLDAWQTAIFEERLDGLRGRAQDGKRGQGVLLGAFGWVEDVRPSSSSIAVTDVPPKLLSPNGVPLREFADNGGFVHAPSINHATAAALLRSGYMSHATPDQPDVLAINLSSERVRRALFVLQGLRNGQSLEALLGYQFERGVHDRASVEPSLGVLNGLIVDIRIAFPIKRARLGAGASSGVEETVEAYDVVNGLTLAETAAPDWAAITGADGTILTASRIAALDAVHDKLEDTLDAVKDLLLAESAHQLVQGNFDRAGAVLGSVKDAHVPPDLDVIKTPRSSHFAFTHRVTVHFDRLDSLDPSAAAWPTAAMTPRALLEPGVNRWLGQTLGAPDAIEFRVFEVGEDGTAVSPAVMTVEDLGLQPIDLVYILGADASTGADGRTGASELESRVAWRYRTDNALDETARVQIQFAEPRNPPAVALGEMVPLLRALQTLLSESRPLDARDYLAATTTGGTPPTNWDFDDLRARTEALQAQLDDATADILQLPFEAVIGGNPVATLAQAFEELNAQAKDVASVFFDFTAGDALALQQALIRLAAFALADAFPRVHGVTSNESKVALISQAKDAVAAATARRAASGTLLADAIAVASTANDRAVALAIDACQAVLGDSFAVLPAFALTNEADVLQAANGRDQLVDHAVANLGMSAPEDEWICGVAHVRPKIAAWERIRLLHETLLGTTLAITAVQVPYRAQDSWLAVGLPQLDPLTGKPFDIARDTLSVVAHGDGLFAPGSLRCGIVVDSWAETIPAREQDTGIAFHYNRPNAMPPQALLLAVPPVMTGRWSWDALVGILNDTLRRAKLRGVEPHLLDKKAGQAELGVLLPAVISEFQQHDLNVSLDLRLNLAALSPALSMHYLNPSTGG